MKINWSAREVDVFLSLAETLSFRRTALQMHLSQSAVSGTVARLEEMLDVRLFERTTRTVQLTLAGGGVAEQARLLTGCAPGAWTLPSPLPPPPMPTWTTPRWCPTALCC